MEDFLATLILAIVQGVTEWLPISSSGHVVLFEKILNYNGTLAFQTALHFGTLMAVFVYFGKDILDILKEVFSLRFNSENGKVGLYLILASVPAAVFGFCFFDFFESVSDNLLIISLGFGLTALILFIASIKNESHEKLNSKKSFLIGLSQAFAILPGISRAGATISFGIVSGLNRKDAARFSFLLSAPVIFGATIFSIGNQKLPPNLIWATMVSFFVGLLSLRFMFGIVLKNKRNLMLFGFYALFLAISILIYLIFF